MEKSLYNLTLAAAQALNYVSVKYAFSGGFVRSRSSSWIQIRLMSSLIFITSLLCQHNISTKSPCIVLRAMNFLHVFCF